MKKKELKVIGFILIILSILGTSFYIISRTEKPDDLYIKMNEINDNKSLIGLSAEEVVELLGKPEYEYCDRENKKIYNFYAGKIVKKSFFGNINGQKYYELRVFFDENDKVEYSYIKLST